jgi:hypothetical protein
MSRTESLLTEIDIPPVIPERDGTPYYTREELEKYRFEQGDFDMYEAEGDEKHLALYRFTTLKGVIEGYFLNASTTFFKEGTDSKEYTFFGGRVEEGGDKEFFDTHVFEGLHKGFHVNNDCVAKRLKLKDEKRGFLFPQDRNCYGVIETKEESGEAPLIITAPIERRNTWQKIEMLTALKQGLRQDNSSLSALPNEVFNKNVMKFVEGKGGKSRRKGKRRTRRKRRTSRK